MTALMFVTFCSILVVVSLRAVVVTEIPKLVKNEQKDSPESLPRAEDC